MHAFWYLVHTNPKKEALVANQLHRQDIEVFYPSLTIERGYGRGNRTEPLFPHYLFVKTDVASGTLPQLRYLPGVRTIVHFGEKPVVVPEQVITQLQDRLQKVDKCVNLADHLYKPGQAVRVKAGPFAGLDAIFQAGVKGTDRAQILLEVLGKLSRVQLDAACLEAI